MGRRLLVSVAFVSLLAGCGSGAGPTPSSVPLASSSASPAALATPTQGPTPVTYGPVTQVAGTHRCPNVSWEWTTDPDGSLHLRDLPIECVDTTDDPRVSGTHTASANMDVWGTLDNGAGVQWASVRLENDGGVWQGRQLGVASLPGLGDTMELWYIGTGGYEGLSYFELITGAEPWEIRGQLFPGSPPPPYVEGTAITRIQAGSPVAADAVAVVAGTAVCPGLDFAWAGTDGMLHVRDDYHADRCAVTTDDPRVSGSRTSTWNIDLWGSLGAGRWGLVQWGTVHLENDGGAWEGRAAGVASYPERGDIFVNWYEGTGAYAGLGYFELWTGFEPWTIQGQIFPGAPPTP